MFLNSSQFPFVKDLENSWKAVAGEYRKIAPAEFTPWPERQIYGEGWDVLACYAYGKRIERYCLLCPITTRLLESIPGMTTAGFSRLAPGTHISQHRGNNNEILRCHLGLTVPAGCVLKVGDDERSWQEGSCLIFDDTTTHEAWNHSDSYRTVLLVDFERKFYPGAKLG